MAKFPYQYSNINGIPRIKARRVTVGTETVDYGFRPDWDLNAFSGLLLVYTETLPVRFIMAGNTQNVTLAGGTNATVANFPNPGVFLVFYDRIDNILQLIGQI